MLATEKYSNDDAHRELLASEARFFNVVDSSPDGVIVIDLSGVICMINDSSLTLFERQRHELLGHEFGFPISSGNKSHIEILCTNSKIKTVEMRVVKIEWEGKPAFLASLRDISEHIRLENELKKSNRELEEFAYTVSHDIKAPLRNMKAIASWLCEDHSTVLSKEATSDLGLLTESADRILRLVDGLLQFSKIGKSNESFAPTKLNDVFQEVLDNLSEDIINSNADVVIDKLPSIKANQILLVLLFQNIISNSIKYCNKENPKIRVCASRGKNQCVIKIADNGLGIEEQYWTKIFTPFKRLHSQNEYDGSGIGLATCKKIIDRHNGRIWLDSTIDSGSTFYISLPDI